MDVVVDTDVFSFIFKGDSRGDLYDKHLVGRRVCVGFVTVSELYRWAIKNSWGQAKVDDLERALGACQVLAWDDAVGWEWARIITAPGPAIAPGDAWVAAIARRHGLPLVTHNRKHFANVQGLTVISES
jgi:tRNA(fMet)-specific endonuclease VapC